MLEAKEDCDSLKDRFPVADQGYSVYMLVSCRHSASRCEVRRNFTKGGPIQPRQTSGFVWPLEI